MAPQCPMGCEVRRLQLPRGHCRGFRDVQLWGDGCHQANLLLARPDGIKASEPWHQVSNRDLTLDLVWAYGQRFCCEQLFRDLKSGIVQLENSRLREPVRIDRLLLVVAIAVQISRLESYSVSLSGQRHCVDPHWKRGLSFARIGLHWLQQSVMVAGRALHPQSRYAQTAETALVHSGGTAFAASDRLNRADTGRMTVSREKCPLVRFRA